MPILLLRGTDPGNDTAEEGPGRVGQPQQTHGDGPLVPPWVIHYMIT